MGVLNADAAIQVPGLMECFDEYKIILIRMLQPSLSPDLNPTKHLWETSEEILTMEPLLTAEHLRNY